MCVCVCGVCVCVCLCVCVIYCELCVLGPSWPPLIRLMSTVCRALFLNFSRVKSSSGPAWGQRTWLLTPDPWTPLRSCEGEAKSVVTHSPGCVNNADMRRTTNSVQVSGPWGAALRRAASVCGYRKNDTPQRGSAAWIATADLTARGAGCRRSRSWMSPREPEVTFGGLNQPSGGVSMPPLRSLLASYIRYLY